MPVFRSPSIGKDYAAIDLREGRFPISPVNDESILLRIKPEDQLPISFDPGGGGHVHIAPYRPYGRVCALLAFLAVWVAFAYFMAFAFHGHASDFWVGAVAFVSVLLLCWVIFIRKPRSFIVFDRDSGLVHIPYFWRREPDVARWEDLSFIIVDERGGYAGMSPVTALYVVRPGHDLLRDGFPPLWKRVMVDGGPAELHTAEQYWAALVRFMRTPSVLPREDIVAMLEKYYGGNWSRYLTSGLRRYKHFDYYKLAKEPNWVREPDGRWRRVAHQQAASLSA